MLKENIKENIKIIVFLTGQAIAISVISFISALIWSVVFSLHQIDKIVASCQESKCWLARP